MSLLNPFISLFTRLKEAEVPIVSPILSVVLAAANYRRCNKAALSLLAKLLYLSVRTQHETNDWATFSSEFIHVSSSHRN